MEDLEKEALSYHSKKHGKIEIMPKTRIMTNRELRLAYTPGVAFACLAIKRDKALSYKYTARGNLVAIVTDGSRILGLGNIGPEAGMPVMEGKAALLKKFGGVDAIPLSVATQDKQRIIEFVKEIEPTFGAINLEDLETPKALEVFMELEKQLSIPIFHDDSYGTGVVTYAALKNALKFVGKSARRVRVVINGAGSAGYGITKMLSAGNVENITVCDREGAIYKNRPKRMNSVKMMLADTTNNDRKEGALAEIAKGADVLIGASTKGAFTKQIVRSMADDPIVFALANPVAEIPYAEAREAGAAIAATGSGLPNQVNNMLAFPGIFRGTLDAKAKRINMDMLVAAGNAIADSVSRKVLSFDYIVPNFSNRREAVNTTKRVAAAVAKAARKTGVSAKRAD